MSNEHQFDPGAQPYPGGKTYTFVNDPPKKSKAGKIALIVVAVVLGLCAVGGIAFTALVGGATEVVKQEAVQRAGDVKLTGCDKTIIDTVEITYTVTNTGKNPAVYTPRFEIQASDKTVIGEAGDITPELKAGGTYKGKAVGMLNDKTAKFSCVLTSS